MAEKEGFGNQGLNAVEPAFSKCPPDIYIKLWFYNKCWGQVMSLAP